MESDNIFDYVVKEENNFQQMRVPIVGDWEWSFFEHIKRSTLYKNSQYEKKKIGEQPFKNITRPIMNLQYRTEGFDVKDIEPFVNDYKNHYKSFLVRKFHPRWARKNDIDTFIDDLVESYCDYGIALIKGTKGKKPEVTPLQRLAFCDQTDILSGPIAEKHMYSPDQMWEMEGKWNADKIDEAIVMAKESKKNSQSNNLEAKTPGKYIEVYEVHGVFPESWLNQGGSTTKYSRQLHVICYYKTADGKKKGISLFCGPEKKNPYKALVRDKIYGRCAGFGGIEELFEPQIWTNYNAIQIREMLDKAALMVLQTADESFKSKNKTDAMQKGEVMIHADGKPVSQLQFQPINMELFNRSTDEWTAIARNLGSANEVSLGNQPASGTPFALQALVNTEGKGLHEYRQGKIATFVGELYRDWFLDDLVTEMNKGQEFIETLTLEELEEIALSVVTNEVEEHINDLIFNKNMAVSSQDRAAMIEKRKAEFMQGGSKRFLKALQDELDRLPMDVEMNIAGKQKDLAKMTDKLTNIFRQVIANPDVLKNPAIAKLFNTILEASGFSAMDFISLTRNTPYSTPVPSPEEMVPKKQEVAAPETVAA